MRLFMVVPFVLAGLLPAGAQSLEQRIEAFDRCVVSAFDHVASSCQAASDLAELVVSMCNAELVGIYDAVYPISQAQDFVTDFKNSRVGFTIAEIAKRRLSHPC